MSIQQDLYQQVILDHNKNPRNYGRLPLSTHHAEGYNPLCGDHLYLDLIVDGSTVIQDVSFQGDGCAISKASASMMTTALKGKTVEEAQQLFEEFILLVTGKLDPEKESNHLGKLKIFSGVWHFPARVKCASLSWHTMKGALEKKNSVSME
ncbi:MAG: SUF system NifU family Fe-S cluster assembly protein [Candidatus Omnitrophica bacterium CG12_big_fil_rev_8_21_14_0_65_50_5]|nr:MAG: SUF system NifU family Fe-S cluster assembly protein [Candidatus Omnitrophica bacterium CG12_big_fil_rev_8_21_14_0_65_50_5]